MRTSLFAAFTAVVSTLSVGCGGAPAAEEELPAENDVVGVTDFVAVETELRLTKDRRDPNGNFKRGDAKLKAGPCFKRTIGGPDGAAFEVRRYVEGAAFFKKKGTTAGTGDLRPVLCIDLDGQGIAGAVTTELNRFEIDLILRYHLGRDLGGDAAAGSVFTEFERGQIQCLNGPSASGPADPIGEPRFRGDIMVGLELNDHETFVWPDVLALAYTYAWNSAKGADTFTLTTDPVGKFLGVEGDTTHYEHVDVVRVPVGAVGEKLFVAPKLAGPEIDARAIVTCSRTIAPLTRFVCTGL